MRHTLRHKHILRDIYIQRETHTQTLRERHTHNLEGHTHTVSTTQTIRKGHNTLRQTHNETETHTWR